MKLALKRLLDRISFYEWAYGHLGESDSEIGVLGEFVAGRALGRLPSRRTVKADFDLVSPEGLNLEVKTTSKRRPSGIFAWDISDQRQALAGKRKLADAWIFLKAAFPEGAATKRTFDPFENRYWTCAVLKGETLRASGLKRELRETTLLRLGGAFRPLRELDRALKEAVAK